MHVIYNNSQPIRLDFSEVLKSQGVTKDGITDAIFIVKSKASDPDEAAVVDLRLGSGLTWASDGKSILANISSAQWANVETQVAYKFAVGFKVADSTSFVESRLSDNVFWVLEDFIRA